MRYASALRVATLVSALLCTVAPVPVSCGQDAVSAALDKLMSGLPVTTGAEKDKVIAGLLKLGEPGIRELCNRIKDKDEPLDGKVCAVLHGLVHAAAESGSEDTRSMVARVLGDILRADATLAAKSYLVTELRTLGGPESVGPVSALLNVTGLCEPAAQALVAIGSAEAAKALRDALPTLAGDERVTVVFALGRIRDRSAVPMLVKEAESAEPASRHAAVFALAEIGDPAAEAVLRQAIAAKDKAECERATHSLLRYGIRLSENGQKSQAVQVLRGLLAQSGPDDPAVAPGAFYELMGILDEAEAVPEIMAGLGHDSAKVRTAALRAAARLPGTEVTKALATALVSLPSDYRAPVADLLRQRGDPAALEAAVQALGDPDKGARIAAIAAIGGLGKRDMAPRLIAFLDKTPEESEAARLALTTMGDSKLNESLVTALPGATPASRCGLLHVLAGRDAAGHRDVFLASAADSDASVRHTALKIVTSLDDAKVVVELMRLFAGTEDAAERTAVEQALVGASRKLSAASHNAVAESLIKQYGAASAPVKCALINALGAMAEGFPEGLGYIGDGLNDASETVRGAALRAQADWPTAEPMEDLLEIARETKDTVEHVLALRGSIRMAGQVAAGVSDEDRDRAAGVLRSALECARRPDEKKQVLGVVSAMSHAGALEMAAECLSDEALKEEATAAVLKIASRAVAQPTEVFVAYDKRVERVPDWLSDWSDTGLDLETTDTGFRLYSKTFGQEVVVLGSNKGGKTSSHYIVILRGGEAGKPTDASAAKAVLGKIGDEGLRKRVETLLAGAETSGLDADRGGKELGVAKVSTGVVYKIVRNGLKDGATVYVDRDFTFKTTPAELSGSTYVMTANDDKRRGDDQHIILSRGEDIPESDDDPSAEPAKAATAPAEPGAPVPAVLDGELVTEYHYADADRPYFYPVIAPTGDNVTRHWPMKDINKDEQQDHTHHRSLWFTHGDVNGHDFWSEGRGPKIVQTKLKVDSGDKRCVIVAENEWRTKEGQVLCTDLRKHTVRKSGDNRMIDFEITIKATHGDVVFGDTKEGSMAFRVAPTLRASGKVAQGAMVNSEGGSGKGIWGKRARWSDYYGPINGKVVGIAIMDHPTNPRHPTTWHARDYGLCAANPFGLSHFEKKPKGAGNMEIKEGESVTFRYRTLVHNGTPEEAGVEALYQDYIKSPELSSIFNGADFAGWVVPKDNIWWEVRDGIISATSGPKKKGSILWTEKSYRDFVIDLEFRFGEGTIDSGIFLRTEKQQVQIGISGSLKRDMTGSVYVPGKGYPKEAEGVRELLKPTDWNTMRVEVLGSVYTVSLNGTRVLVYEASQAIDEGPIGLQLHPGKVMAIDFRNIRVAALD